MITLRSVHFDDFIPSWRSYMDTLTFNVLVVVVQGKVTYTLNGNEVNAEKGDLLLFPKGTIRIGDNAAEGPHQKYTCIFDYDYNGLKDEEEIPFLDQAAILHFKTRSFEYIKQRFALLHRENMENKPYSQLISLGIVRELLALVGRETETTQISPIKFKYVKIIQQYLLTNYRQPIQIERLAGLIQRSPNYTISLFKEVTGQSPIHYMHQLRIIEGRNLLLNSDMTVSDISNYLGYYDTSYFFRVFKKYTSMSPSAFRPEGAFE